MKQKIKNYEWNGFGFPVIFDELPAVKLRGELVPDVDFQELAAPLIQFICTTQDSAFSGNQVKFIRMHFNMSLRDFAEFMGVTHQSVMRWEKKEKASAHMGAHVEFFMKVRILRKLHSKKALLETAMERTEDASSAKQPNYKIQKPLKVPEDVVHDFL